MVSFSFNPNEVPADEGFTPIPAGRYLAQVISSEIKPTKNGTGTILKLTSQVLDGEYSGRLLFDNLNISNPNADAERISARALADLCLAIGISILRNTEELHFKPFFARVGIRHDKTGAYPPQNTIRYEAREGAATAPTTEADLGVVRHKAPTAAKPNGNKPWMKPQPRF